MIMFELRKYRGIIFDKSSNDAKFEQKVTCGLVYDDAKFEEKIT